MKKLRFYIVVIIMIKTTVCFAQHNHGGGGCGDHSSHKEMTPMQNPPHGGMVQKAGKYYIEMVVNILQKEDKVMFYLINSKGKMLPNTNITANITFIADDGTTITQDATAKGEDFFVTQLKDNSPFRCIVTFTVKNRKYSARFDHHGLNSPKEQGKTYTCSMHPEIESSTPGSCPKCGMSLIEEK